MKPRLLFVGAFPPAGSAIYGGNVTACRRLLESSFAQRLELDLLDSTQISNPPPRLPLRLILAARRFARYIARFERKRPDAVLLLAALGASVIEKGAMAWYARLRGVPAYIFPRGGALLDSCEQSAGRRTAVRLALGSATAIFCQGARWQRFARDVIGVPGEAAPLIPNWSATGELLAIGRARTYDAHSALRLIFVGWLDHEKGVEELLSACRDLPSNSNFTLALVGEGNMSRRARDLVTVWEMSDRIEFIGSVDEPELRNQLTRSDIFVLPSWAEGLPNAMIEAMAAGLPVIVSAVGAIPDYVEHDVHALLVQPGNVQQLTHAITRLLEDGALRQRLGRAGHALAATEFTVEQAADRMIAELTRGARVQTGVRESAV